MGRVQSIDVIHCLSPPNPGPGTPTILPTEERRRHREVERLPKAAQHVSDRASIWTQQSGPRVHSLSPPGPCVLESLGRKVTWWEGVGRSLELRAVGEGKLWPPFWSGTDTKGAS